MKDIQQDFRNKVVVITGASAGVGRAAAQAFAQRGAELALIARDAEGLESARAEIAEEGGRVEVFPLDVADPGAVFAAAEEIETRLGPIDVWVNNAMATVFSPVSELTPEEVHRVTEVTYFGYVHGTLAALKYMRERDRGTIVQVGSSLAYRGIPLQAPYCGAKHAMRGFTDSIRTELLHDGSHVELTVVHLPAINTPQFQWARSKRSHLPRPVAPVFAAPVAGRAIVQAARYPVREYWLGGSTFLTILGNMIVPQVMDRILARNAVEGQDRDAPNSEDRRDNLFVPVPGLHSMRGPFRQEARDHAMLIPAPVGRIGTVILGAGLTAAIGGLMLGHKLASRDRRRIR